MVERKENRADPIEKKVARAPVSRDPAAAPSNGDFEARSETAGVAEDLSLSIDHTDPRLQSPVQPREDPRRLLPREPPGSESAAASTRPCCTIDRSCASRSCFS